MSFSVVEAEGEEGGMSNGSWLTGSRKTRVRQESKEPLETDQLLVAAMAGAIAKSLCLKSAVLALSLSRSRISIDMNYAVYNYCHESSNNGQHKTNTFLWLGRAKGNVKPGAKRLNNNRLLSHNTTCTNWYVRVLPTSPAAVCALFSTSIDEKERSSQLMCNMWSSGKDVWMG